MTHTSFAVGDLTIHRIVEMECGFMSPFEFLPDLDRAVFEENRAWLEPAAYDPATGMLVFSFHSYVIRTPHHTVLVDSCIGNDKTRPHYPNWHRKTDQTWMRGLATLGLTVADIDYVLCTHLHSDHVGWNTRLENGRWVPTFPNARYLFAQDEYAYWTERHLTSPLTQMTDSVLPVIEAGRAELVAHDHALGDHVRLMPTPGHTPGHVAVAAGRGRDRAVFTGDLIHSPLQARYPELGTKFDTDRAQADHTRRDFLARYSGTDTLCCTMHFPSPSVGHVTPWGDGFRLRDPA